MQRRGNCLSSKKGVSYQRNELVSLLYTHCKFFSYWIGPQNIKNVSYFVISGHFPCYLTIMWSLGFHTHSFLATSTWENVFVQISRSQLQCRMICFCNNYCSSRNFTPRVEDFGKFCPSLYFTTRTKHLYKYRTKTIVWGPFLAIILVVIWFLLHIIGCLNLIP